MTTPAQRVVAAAFGGPEVLEVQEVTLPDPGPGQAVVSLRAAGVNPIDAKLYGGPGDASDLPVLLGFEGAGVVTAVGEGAADDQGLLAVGDEVIAFRVGGAYATDLRRGRRHPDPEACRRSAGRSPPSSCSPARPPSTP